MSVIMRQRIYKKKREKMFAGDNVLSSTFSVHEKQFKYNYLLITLVCPRKKLRDLINI